MKQGIFISPNKAIELLNAGHSLTVPGKDLNTLRKDDEESYSWKGMRDQGPTILSKEEVEGLIPKYYWEIDLL